ncbi:MAG: YiiD C-terminal domain-containing protein [Flavobacteriaceae bacterium]|nr:YiiD C-terminal domain-containing protein [Flavobacteriaceae bacterium]
MYQKATSFLLQFMSKATLFKWGFNLSPMYRHTKAKIMHVSEDLQEVAIKIPLTFGNKNFVGSIFGGSLFAATDPIFMIQLLWILGKEYVVWDKAASINYKKPAYENAYCTFKLNGQLLDRIKNEVATHGEMDLVLKATICSKEGLVFCELDKTLYIATKTHYKEKMTQRKQQ